MTSSQVGLMNLQLVGGGGGDQGQGTAVGSPPDPHERWGAGPGDQGQGTAVGSPAEPGERWGAGPGEYKLFF